MAGQSTCSSDSTGDHAVPQSGLLRADIQELLLEQRLHLVEALHEGLSTQTKAIDNLTSQQVALEKEVKLAVQAGALGDCLGKHLPVTSHFSDKWNFVGHSRRNNGAAVVPNYPRESEVRKNFEDRAEIAVQKLRNSIYADLAQKHVTRRQRFRKFCMELCLTPRCNCKRIRPVAWIRQGLRDAAQHPYFDVVFSVLVLLNTALIGVEVETSKEPIKELNHLQRLFGVIFTIELFLRVHAAGRTFFRPPRLWGNLFDSFLLLTFVTDWIPSQNEISGGQFLRLLRLARIMRAFRAVRMASYAPEFRKMAYALQHSVLTLFWALLLLFFIIYCFATTLTQASSVKVQPHEDCPNIEETLNKHWGNISRSIYSLYASICGGYSWNELAAPLGCAGHLYFAIYMVYTSVAIFGVLNVVTSVFVDSAMESTQHFVDIKVGEALSSRKVLVNHLRQMFEDLDVDNSGEISIKEMQVLMQNTQLANYLEAIDIRFDEIDLLFAMLDFDGSGTINIDEFCEGCLRLMGQAKSFDIHCMNDQLQSMLYFSERTLAKVADVAAMLNNYGLSADMPPRKTTRFLIKASTLASVNPLKRPVTPLEHFWTPDARASGTSNCSAQVNSPEPLIQQVSKAELEVYQI
mmetsp:Transcript_56463/g.112222  ORF Transcript_56463/g.112222 Transcript_56463/m.112222 type:complete len:633 (-) Transcript_56463:112-2010(-)